MSEKNIRRASLEDIERMREAGELHYNPNAETDHEELGQEFWATAKIEHPSSRSVHLRLDHDVFDFFYKQAAGKGHLTKMQNVLKAYAKAQSKA